MKDETGKVYGQLTVIRRSDKLLRWKCIAWECLCTCGVLHVVNGRDLRRGATTSCGCTKGQKCAASNTKHGCATRGLTAEYRCWSNIIDRCEQPTNKSYADYGARGIKVCERWRTSFADFLADITGTIGLKPSPQHSIDRIDNERGYELGNVQWATRTVQVRNRRSTRRLTHDGKTLTLKEWADLIGVKYTTLFCRIRSGMTTSAALTMPTRERSRQLEVIVLQKLKGAAAVQEIGPGLFAGDRDEAIG